MAKIGNKLCAQNTLSFHCCRFNFFKENLSSKMANNYAKFTFSNK
jgi:hypothetical protein